MIRSAESIDVLALPCLESLFESAADWATHRSSFRHCARDTVSTMQSRIDQGASYSAPVLSLLAAFFTAAFV
jgi:hypothetical protein